MIEAVDQMVKMYRCALKEDSEHMDSLETFNKEMQPILRQLKEGTV